MALTCSLVSEAISVAVIPLYCVLVQFAMVVLLGSAMMFSPDRAIYDLFTDQSDRHKNDTNTLLAPVYCKHNKCCINNIIANSNNYAVL